MGKTIKALLKHVQGCEECNGVHFCIMALGLKADFDRAWSKEKDRLKPAKLVAKAVVSSVGDTITIDEMMGVLQGINDGTARFHR